MHILRGGSSQLLLLLLCKLAAIAGINKATNTDESTREIPTPSKDDTILWGRIKRREGTTGTDRIIGAGRIDDSGISLKNV